VTTSRHRGRSRRPPSRGSRLFKPVRDAWREGVGFERREQVAAAGWQWTVVYKIHTLPAMTGPATHEFKSSITVWPAAPPTRPRGHGLRDTEAVSGWRQHVQSRLRRHGYRGRWEKSPDGRFGDFWKSLPSAAAVAVEVKRLERLRL
jgi:hypothetical protein